MSVDGQLIASTSIFGPRQTMDKLATAVEKQGMAVMARIDHAAAAASAGMELRPTEVLIFGNPKVGTRLMAAEQTIGIDLPLKALVWQDDHGQTWLGYTDPKSIAERYAIKSELRMIFDQMAHALMKVADEATTKPAGDNS